MKDIILLFICLAWFATGSLSYALDCSHTPVRRVLVPAETIIFHAQKDCPTPPKGIFVVEEAFNIKNQILGKISCGSVNYTIFVSDSDPNNESLYYMIETSSLLCL
ncbi:MAG: hypothetical protein SGJ18_05395 [Pseudomonadota bacterium]|nr:hypothetical protein [Pseudomonadota bacterium]